ncbi:hypothetical protein MTO96_029839 [Rhipicephalus appendiculatus]
MTPRLRILKFLFMLSSLWPLSTHACFWKHDDEDVIAREKYAGCPEHEEICQARCRVYMNTEGVCDLQYPKRCVCL